MIRPPENEAEMRRFYQDLCAKTNQIDTFYNVRGVNYVSGQDITDEINNATSDVIVIPPGTYTVSGDITLTNKTLTGPGILNFTAGDLYIVNSSGTHGISGITVINATVWVHDSTNVFITDCTVRDSNKTGIYIYKSCSNIHVTGNKIISVGKTEVNGKGIAVFGFWGGVSVPCTDVIVSKNIVIESGGLGIESWGFNRRVVISDNLVKGVYQADGFGISVSSCDDHVVSNNIVEQTTAAVEYGIEIAASNRVIAQGNVVRGVKRGVDLSGAGSDCVIDGNLLYGVQTIGVRTIGSGHTVTNNLIKDCEGYVFYNHAGTNIIFKNNTGNGTGVTNAGQAIFNDNGTCWAEGNHITSANTIPVQSYNTSAVLTMKNNYFGVGGTSYPIEQELSGGKIRILGHVSGTTPVGFYDSVETGITRSPARRFIRSTSTDPFTIRIKLQKTAGNQPSSSFMVFWASRDGNTPRGGMFIAAFGNWTNYNGTPVLTQMGDTVTPAAVAYDASSYPYWDFAMVTNESENHAIVYMVGGSVTDIDEEYIISAV